MSPGVLAIAALGIANVISGLRTLSRLPNFCGFEGAGWSKKDERMYTHIVDGCRGRRPIKDCKRIAGATVNKRRRTEGRLLRK